MRIARIVILGSLLAFQVGAIVYARTVESRYFCWAPYDQQTRYQIDVTVNGKKLSADEIRQRYRRPKMGNDNRSVRHVKDILEGAERQYHPQDQVEIVLTYRINGKEEQTWRYQQP